jgi:hypothetical protein
VHVLHGRQRETREGGGKAQRERAKHEHYPDATGSLPGRQLKSL